MKSTKSATQGDNASSSDAYFRVLLAPAATGRSARTRPPVVRRPRLGQGGRGLAQRPESPRRLRAHPRRLCGMFRGQERERSRPDFLRSITLEANGELASTPACRRLSLARALPSVAPCRRCCLSWMGPVLDGACPGWGLSWMGLHPAACDLRRDAERLSRRDAFRRRGISPRPGPFAHGGGVTRRRPRACRAIRQCCRRALRDRA